MTRRPAGVVLSAVILGLAALLQLLMAAVTLFSAIAIGRHSDITLTAPGVTPPPPGFLAAAIALMACFYLVLAVWAIATLAGLLRMKPWARISIMIIGGGLAFVGLMSALSCFAAPMLLQTAPMPPGTNPAVLHGVFLIVAVFSLLIAALGVAWIIYFALRRTREAFSPPPQVVAAAPPAFPAPLTHAHKLDFSVAEPLEVAPTLEQPPPAAYAQTWSQTTAPILQSAPPKRPVSITVLAILFLICGVCALPSLALPFPLFFFGVVLSGWPAHLILLVFAVWMSITGIGLLKLQKPAWFMAVVYCVIGILNTLTMVLPTGRLRMSQYLETLSHTASMGMTTPQPIDIFAPRFFNLLILPGILFGVAMILLVLVLLWRARWAFEPAPKP